MLMDTGLSEACQRTGTYVARTPQRTRLSDDPESQRQQQRSNMRNQQQQQNLTREYEFESPVQRMDLFSQQMNHQPNPAYSPVPAFQQPVIPTQSPMPGGAAFRQQIVEAAMRQMNGGQGFQQ